MEAAIERCSHTLCLIARNEATVLPAALASVRGLPFDTVVVDTGSTDGSQSIARAHGATVVDFPWCDDFAAARNEAIRHARGDWIFWMDADDRLPEASRAKLAELLTSLPTSGDGFLMTVHCASSIALSRASVEHVRLFPNHADIRFRYRVHEQVAPSILRAGGKLCKTDIIIEHVGYRDASVYRAKQERNLRLLELQLRATPLDPFMLYYHGSTLLDLARPAEAIVSLNLAAGLVPGETAVGRLLPSALARAYADDGMVGEARTTLERAFFQYPDDPATVFAFTSFLYEAGDLERAERELSAFLDSGAPAPDIGVGDAALSDFRMRHLRASVRYLLGRYGDSERDARRVVETCESFGDGYLVLGDALLAQGRYEQLAALRRELAGGDGGSILISLLDASARALQGDLVGAGAILDREIASSGPHVFLERALGRLESGSTSVPLAAHALARDRTWVRV